MDAERSKGDAVHITGKNREGLKRAVEYLQEVELRLERVDEDLEELRKIAMDAASVVIEIEQRVAAVEGEISFTKDEIGGL